LPTCPCNESLWDWVKCRPTTNGGTNRARKPYSTASRTPLQRISNKTTILQMSKSLLALACVAAIYGVLAFLVLPQDAFFSSDEGLKFIQLQNFTRKGWRDFTIDYPGRDLDPELSYVPINNPPPLIRDGKIFAVYPIFFPLLATPLYQHLHYTGLYLIPLLSGLLTLALSAYLVRLTGEDDHWPVLLLIGLGTPLLFYSLLFWDHTLGTMLSTLALILVTWEGGQARLPYSMRSSSSTLAIQRTIRD